MEAIELRLGRAPWGTGEAPLLGGALLTRRICGTSEICAKINLGRT